MLVSVGFVLLIFLAVVAVMTGREAETALVEDVLRNRTDCDAVAIEVEAAFAGGKGTTIYRTSDRNLTVYGDAGQIEAGSVTCISVANITNGTHHRFVLNEGRIEIRSLGEEVLVRNV